MGNEYSTKLLDVSGQVLGHFSCEKKCPKSVNVSEYLLSVLPNVRMEGEVHTFVASSFAIDKLWSNVRHCSLDEQKFLYTQKVTKYVNNHDTGLCACLLGGGRLFYTNGVFSSHVNDQSDKIDKPRTIN